METVGVVIELCMEDMWKERVSCVGVVCRKCMQGVMLECVVDAW